MITQINLICQVLPMKNWIWLMNGDKTLTLAIRKRIEQAYGEGTLYVAAILAWEVSMLEKKNRVRLNKPCLEWIRVALNHGIQLLPLTPEIAVDSSQLPAYDAGDPADRLIIATARIESLTLLTRDENILAYGAQQRVSVLAV